MHTMFSLHHASVILSLPLVLGAAASEYPFRRYIPETNECRKITVAILGAGVAGITAAQALANSSIDDFIIIDYNDHIGGRLVNVNFGKKEDGNPWVVELGANWVHGLGGNGNPENPIWSMVKKHNIATQLSDRSEALTFNEEGETDVGPLIVAYEQAVNAIVEKASEIVEGDVHDQSVRTALHLAGWKPTTSSMDAVESWLFDWPNIYPPEQSSMVFGLVGVNSTYEYFSDDDLLSTDQRGFSTWLKDEAFSFLKGEQDPRLLLNTIVTNISYSSDGVTITNNDSSCVRADYAICTFSLGVLQREVVSFNPDLPPEKREAIAAFDMGTYTKIFMQFPTRFWLEEAQFLMYASPTRRGYYPVFQSLSAPGFLDDSNILVGVVVNKEAIRVSRQPENRTKDEAMAVLRQMFPDTVVPEPTDFMITDWAETPWSYGSYSNWPAGTTFEVHENLRSPLDRLWFAGEATSSNYFGYLHGAWFEGRAAGTEIADLIKE